MSYFLIGCYLAALGVYLWARPAWRNIGPSLLNSFVLGLLLFASGSIAVWFEGLTDAESVMRIGVAAALSGTLGSSIWSGLFRSRISGLDFFRSSSQLRAESGDRFAITVGLAVSALISLVFLVAVFSHEHIGALLRSAIFEGKGTLNEARIIISAGTEGYFAPGYVKQFRDVMLPILCMAAVLCHGTYPYRSLFYIGLIVALASVFISGQRLVVLQFTLGFGCVFLMDLVSARRPHFVPLKIAIPMLIAMIALVGVMTEMLGRLDMVLSPRADQAGQVEVKQAQLRKQQIAEETAELETRISKLKTEPELPGVTAPVDGRSDGRAADVKGLKAAQKEIQDLETEKNKIDQMLIRAENAAPPPNQFSETLSSSGLPRPVATVIALAHRAIIAVPRENTITYSYWASRSPAIGGGWITDLSGLRPGTQSQLSNELSQVNYGGPQGNSPLGLATDVYYNWGWAGVAIVPPLYALIFLVLDLVFAESASPLLFAAKIFMFFSVPLMYSPFMFILYGGAVVLALAGYVFLLRRGASSFLGLRA